MATVTFELFECPADTDPHAPDRRHGFPDDTGVCVCGETWVSRTVEFDVEHPLVKAFSSPTVHRTRERRQRPS